MKDTMKQAPNEQEMSFAIILRKILRYLGAMICLFHSIFSLQI